MEDRFGGVLAVVPTGTPVSAPLQTDGTRVQVMLLDALWHWTSSAKCDPVHRGPVWMDAGAIPAATSPLGRAQRRSGLGSRGRRGAHAFEDGNTLTTRSKRNARLPFILN